MRNMVSQTSTTDFMRSLEDSCDAPPSTYSEVHSPALVSRDAASGTSFPDLELHSLHIPHSSFHDLDYDIAPSAGSNGFFNSNMYRDLSMTNLCHSEDDDDDECLTRTESPAAHVRSSSISFPVLRTASSSTSDSSEHRSSVDGADTSVDLPHNDDDDGGGEASPRDDTTTSSSTPYASNDDATLGASSPANAAAHFVRRFLERAISLDDAMVWRSSGYKVDRRNFAENFADSAFSPDAENAASSPSDCKLVEDGIPLAVKMKFLTGNMSRLCHSQPSSPVGARAHKAPQPAMFSGPLPHTDPFVSTPELLMPGRSAAGATRNRKGNYSLFRTWSTERLRASPRGESWPPAAAAGDDECGWAAEEREIWREDAAAAARDVSAGRYFDALKGPELETPKDSEDLLLPSDELWPFLLRFPIGVFRISLGLGCQSVLWRDLHGVPCMRFLHIPPSVHVGIWWLALAALVAISAVYAAKCAVYFEAVRREFHHPVRVNYFFTPWIAAMFLAQSAPGEGARVGPAVWAVLMAPIVALELKLYGQWISGGERRLSKVANPSTHLAVVGNFVGAKLAAIVGWSEVAILFWAIGLAHYLVLFVTLYQRLPTNVVLPKELHPVYFLFVAVPSSASVSWKFISGSFGNLSKIFFFIALFLYSSLGIRFNFFRGSRFSVAWWAYTFPMSAAAIASIHYAQEVTTHLSLGLALFLALIASLTVLGLLCVTFLHAVVWRPLFPNDMAIAITATKHHGKLHIKKKSLPKDSPSTKFGVGNHGYPDFTVNVQPDLALGKLRSPNLAKLFSISSVDRSSVVVDMVER